MDYVINRIDYLFILFPIYNIYRHIYSAFALFNWWLMLRQRAHNPIPILSNFFTGVFRLDIELISVGFFVIVRNSVRRLFMPLTSLSDDFKLNVRLFFEALFFTILGYQVLFVLPDIIAGKADPKAMILPDSKPPVKGKDIIIICY